MKKILAFSLIMVMVLISGCSSNAATGAQKLSSNNEIVETKEDTEPDDRFMEATADFAIELFKRSGTEEGNVLVSPVSVMFALGMTANGADNATLQEFEQVLGNGMTIDEINAYYSSYMKKLPDTKETKMSIANSIWFRDTDTFKVNEDFLENNEMYYKSDIYKAVFDKSTVKDINNWVDSKTDGMIDGIIEELNPDDIMILINAIAFDGEWVDVYEENQVHDTEFTDVSGSKLSVEGMYCSVGTYLEDESTTGFIKNYKNGYSFVALLPNVDISIDEYIADFTGEKYLNLVNNSIACEVNTMIPKFSYDFQMNASEALADMGLRSAFDAIAADFSRMGEDAGGDLYIGSVIHKTHIEMAEKGTKAGAATAVIMSDNAVAPMEIKNVHLDRPFVYAIVDNETNIPVFMGVLNTIE